MESRGRDAMVERQIKPHLGVCRYKHYSAAPVTLNSSAQRGKRLLVTMWNKISTQKISLRVTAQEFHYKFCLNYEIQPTVKHNSNYSRRTCTWMMSGEKSEEERKSL